MQKKYEVLINGVRHLLTITPDSGRADRTMETGMMHLVLPGPLASSPETVIADMPYNELTFLPLPFFTIKPIS